VTKCGCYQVCVGAASDVGPVFRLRCGRDVLPLHEIRASVHFLAVQYYSSQWRRSLAQGQWDTVRDIADGTCLACSSSVFIEEYMLFD
jgi:hypothetical protein